MDIKKTMSNLEKNGFEVSYFETGSDAARYIASQLTGRTVGIGGSKTIEALGLFETLSENNEVYWHWRQPVQEARKNSAGAEIYLCSANAIAETGEIINIDADGNRLAASLYGKEKVFIVVGKNKIAEDFEKAMWRARNIAAPLNAKRLNRNTPCVKSEETKCYDCSSPERICRGVSIMLRKLNGVDTCEVVIINEDLGY